MTRKLYYEDCHLTRFESRVADCRKTEKGYEIILDATAFILRAAVRPATWAF